MKAAFVAIVSCMLSVAVAASTSSPSFEHPLIEGHGGSIALPTAAHQPRPDSQVLLDITADDRAGSVLKGLDRAALILNQYAQADAGPDRGLKMAIVLHGPATKAALTHGAFARHTKPYARDLGKQENPNLNLMRQLTRAGVEIYVCGQALAHQGYATTEVAEEVIVAVSAASVMINLQQDGYATIPFH